MNKSKLKENSVLTIHELKEIIKGCRLEFVCNSFAELAELHTKKEALRAALEGNAPDKATRLKQLLVGWPQFNVGDIVWAMSSCPIPTNLCSSAEDGTENDTWVNGLKRNVLIDLINKKQTIDGKSYSIGATMVKLSSSETKPRYLCMYGEDNLPYIAHICEDGENGKHLLISSFDEKNDVTWSATNIDEFAMLSEINTGTDSESGKGSCGHILTCFNKALGVVFTEVLPGRKDVKLSLGGVEDMDISKPLTDLLDGCHQYLKYKDTLFTREQKHFFGNYQPSKVIGVYSDEHIAKILSFSEKLNQKATDQTSGSVPGNSVETNKN